MVGGQGVVSCYSFVVIEGSDVWKEMIAASCASAFVEIYICIHRYILSVIAFNTSKR
jgi:hypothetical protein